MGLNWPNNNHGYAPAFQTSGFPFVTGSASTTSVTDTPVYVRFPYATRWVLVRNLGAGPLRVGFTENGIEGPLGTEFNPGGYDVTGSNRNYYVLHAGDQFNSTLGPIEVKCMGMWFRRHDDAGPTNVGYELMAGYTNIPASGMLNLTGSNAFQGIG